MNRPKILALLELNENTPILLLSLETRLWGRDLIFNAQASEKNFRLCFLDCSEARWRQYLHHESSAQAFIPTELLNFKIGRNQGRSPAQLLSEHFGLMLIYGALWLEWDDGRVELA